MAALFYAELSDQATAWGVAAGFVINLPTWVLVGVFRAADSLSAEAMVTMAVAHFFSAGVFLSIFGFAGVTGAFGPIPILWIPMLMVYLATPALKRGHEHHPSSHQRPDFAK